MLNFLRKTLFVLSMLLTSQSWAAIVYVDNVYFTEVSAYDDYEGGLVYVGMSNVHSSCQSGGYLNPESLGYQTLYSLLLTAATTGRAATVQLYDDRKKSERCEIDAIRLFY